MSEAYNEVKTLKSYKCVWVEGKLTRLHRHIMEQHLGRKLLSTEIVHHINENIWDNRIENLEITNRSEHARHHILKLPRLKLGNVLCCSVCGSERYYCPRMYDRVNKPTYKCKSCYATK